MQRLLIALIAVLALTGIAAFIALKNRSFQVVVPESTIREKMVEAMPYTKTYLLIFDVTLSNPRVDLVDGSSRIDAGLDVALDLRLEGQAKRLGGSVDVSSGVTYRPESGAFHLVDPVVEQLAIDGLPVIYSDRARKAVGVAIEAWYRERPIYVLGRTDLKQSAASLLLQDVTVAGDQLIVTLGL
jgi:hypothetical protein